MFLFTTMRQGSQRCPNKLCRDLEIGSNLSEICMAKMASMAKTGNFSGWGVSIHEGDEALMSSARLMGVPVMRRSAESATGAPPVSVIFEALHNVQDNWVMWVNPGLPLFPALELVTAAHYFRPEEMLSMTPVRRLQNWVWFEEGRPVTRVDHPQVATQSLSPLFAACHAFHIFDRRRLLAENRYWTGEVADPVLYYTSGPEEWYMDVDTKHDLAIVDQYLISRVRTMDNLLKTYCTA